MLFSLLNASGSYYMQYWQKWTYRVSLLKSLLRPSTYNSDTSLLVPLQLEQDRLFIAVAMPIENSTGSHCIEYQDHLK
jgi:hypothetical protein